MAKPKANNATESIIAKLTGKPESDWPSVAELVEEFGVHEGTVRRALDKLRAKQASPIKGEVRAVPLADLVIDAGIQMREKEDKEHVGRVKLAYEQEPASVPPLVAFEVPKVGLVLAGGFHRRLAAIELGLQSVKVDVRQGTREDAVAYAAADNATHGLPRDRETQRRSVVAFLALPRAKKMTTQSIADHCKVSWDLVDAIQKGYGSVSEKRKAEANGEKRDKGDTVKLVERDGKTFEVDTTKLGKGKKAEVPTSEPADECETFAPELDWVGDADGDGGMTVEAWLETLPLSRSHSIDLDAFKAQALAYLALQPMLKVYREAVKAEIPDAEGAYAGAFGNLLRGPLSILHPRDWKVCPVCHGKGKSGKSPCHSCHGGFHVR